MHTFKHKHLADDCGVSKIGIHTYIHVHVYVHIYTYVHTYIHLHIYAFIQTQTPTYNECKVDF